MYRYMVAIFLVMGAHLTKHGDGVKDVAFDVENCIGIFKVRIYWGVGGLCGGQSPCQLIVYTGFFQGIRVRV